MSISSDSGRTTIEYRKVWRYMFGPENVGAIHGALLTAWSAAAIAGPVIITELSARDRAGLARGASKIHIYDRLLQILARLLAAGFLAILVRSVRPNQEA